MAKKCSVRPPRKKFHENPSDESRTDPCGQTDGTGMTWLTVEFCNCLAKAPKNGKTINSTYKRIVSVLEQ